MVRHRLLSLVAARARRSLGMDDVSQRLGDIEAGLAQLRSDRYPHGPLYFGDHTALVATRWGAKMLVDTRDAAISPWIVLDGLWETHVTAWLQQTLQPGQVFVDVGANVGYFTLLGAQLVGPGGRVVAVEAHPGLAELLRRNVIMNGLYGYVTTWHRAAWSSTTSVQLHQRLNFSGASSVGAIGSEALGRLGDSEEMVEVQAVPLDDLLEGLPPVDVLKMDIEGAELQAFTGLSRTLEASPKISVMFEWAPALMEAVGDKADALVDLLEGHGLHFRLLEDGLSPIERAKLLDLPYGNVVAAR
ncbi:MAG TPA: FkbM family methyltransferase [Acidimicrobiales bacterium]|nr:FkbM family methyltransferase [Acidimicrobiales bacterium]